MKEELTLMFYQRNQEPREPRKKNEKRESSNSIPPCRRVCWKQEPKGVITYTPKSDMTIHLGVVAGVVAVVEGADLLTVWLLTVSLGWLVRISHCVSALDERQIKISTIADRQTLVELGFGFSFPFILKNCSSANFAPKCGVTARGLRPRRINFTCFKDRPWDFDLELYFLPLFLQIFL